MSAADSGAEVVEFLRLQVSERTGVPIDEVGANSNLVDLGLQSIDAVLLCGEVEDRFQLELDPATIFEHDTLGSFSGAILERLST